MPFAAGARTVPIIDWQLLWSFVPILLLLIFLTISLFNLKNVNYVD